jgi:hypothetical protein
LIQVFSLFGNKKQSGFLFFIDQQLHQKPVIAWVLSESKAKSKAMIVWVIE